MNDPYDRLQDLRIERDDENDPGRPWGRWLALLLVAVVVVGLALWWWLGRTSGPQVETAPVREIAGGAAGAVGGLSVLDASGYVTARRQATVSAKVTGRLTSVEVEEGMRVEADQVLARLDDATARRELALSEAQLAAARSRRAETEVRLREARVELERVRSLQSAGIHSRSMLDSAEAEADSLAARVVAERDEEVVAMRGVALARQNLEDTLVRAPFDGIAISKDAQPGEIVSPISGGGGFTRTGITTIVDMSSLEIEVDVNEAYIGRVEPGQPVVAVLDAYPQWRIPAHVIITVPAADRQRATFKVRIAFDEVDDPRILPDMGVKVSFQADDPPEAAEGEADGPRLLVPRDAVTRDGGADVVFVVRQGSVQPTVERRAVALGGTLGTEVEVLSGVRATDRVVVSPPEELADGDAVRVADGG